MVGVIATGHSSWDPKAPDPYVRVPANTRVFYYQEPLHLLADEVGRQLEQLDEAALAGHVKVAEAGETVRNLTLSHPEKLNYALVPDDHPRFKQIIPSTGAPRRLAQVLAEFTGHEIYWAACLAVRLDRVGGEYIGVNTGWTRRNRPGDGRAVGPYREDAELLAAVSAHPENDPSTESALYVRDLVESALPEGASYSSVEWPMSSLYSAKDDPEQLSAAFAGLLADERRGLLLNDTLRWWLADQGIFVPGHVSDRLVEIDEPVFWQARPATDLAAHNHAALWNLEPNARVALRYHQDVGPIVGDDLPPPIANWCEARERHGFDPVIMVVEPTVVDRHVCWVVHGCPESLRGELHQAMSALGAEDVWFDQAPRRVFDADVFSDVVRTNTEALRALEPPDTTVVLVNDRYAVVGWDAPNWLYQEIRDSGHHCDGMLTVIATESSTQDIEAFLIDDVGTDCSCRQVLETMVDIVRGETGTQVPLRYRN